MTSAIAEMIVATINDPENARKKVDPSAGEMVLTPGNCANSITDDILIPIVIPKVRANELNEPATPETFLSTVPIVIALFGDKKSDIPAPLIKIGIRMRMSEAFCG